MSGLGLPSASTYIECYPLPRSPVKRPPPDIDLSGVLREVDDLPSLLSSQSLFANYRVNNPRWLTQRRHALCVTYSAESSIKDCSRSGNASR